MVDEQTKNLSTSVGIIILYPKLREEKIDLQVILSASFFPVIMTYTKNK